MTLFSLNTLSAEPVDPNNRFQLAKQDYAPLQKNAFNDISAVAKPYKLEYTDWVGRRGTINPNPVKVDGVSSLYKVYELHFDGLEQPLYYQVYKPKEKHPLDKWNGPLVRISDLQDGESLVGQSIYLDSPVKLTRYYARMQRYYIEGIEEGFKSEDLSIIKKLLSYIDNRENDLSLVSALSDHRIKYDKFDQIIDLSPAPYRFKGEQSPAIAIRTKIDGRGHAKQFVDVTYRAESWLFANQYIILAGDQRYESKVEDFKRDNSSTVWEWRTETMNDEIKYLLEQLVVDPEAAIRFIGKDYVHDYEFTIQEKLAIKEALMFSNLFP
jgi:hypothetical protein